jgi:UDP-3-O-[3-hydroxymyristoyl] glucosamine N-acyltransferase
MTPPHAGFLLSELAARTGARVEGADVRVHRVGTLDHGEPGSITFLANARYRDSLAATRASAVILAPRDASTTALPRLVSDNPYATYAKVATLLHPVHAEAPGIHASALVDDTAQVDPTATVGPFCVVGARARIGAAARLGAHCHVGEDARIGEATVLHPGVTLYPRCSVGARGVVHSGVVIGADGFGLAPDNGAWLRIPQVGRVVVGDDVDIGANTTIDRGAIDDTVIGDGVKLDNQIQIGHNCVIGAHTAIAGCVGIAGSTRIGERCRIGGAAMISGHLSIAAGTTVSGGTLVADSIEQAGMYTGVFPTLPHEQWKRVAAHLRTLRELRARVRALERALDALLEVGNQGERP